MPAPRQHPDSLFPLNSVHVGLGLTPLMGWTVPFLHPHGEILAAGPQSVWRWGLHRGYGVKWDHWGGLWVHWRPAEKRLGHRHAEKTLGGSRGEVAPASQGERPQEKPALWHLDFRRLAFRLWGTMFPWPWLVCGAPLGQPEWTDAAHLQYAVHRCPAFRQNEFTSFPTLSLALLTKYSESCPSHEVWLLMISDWLPEHQQRSHHLKTSKRQWPSWAPRPATDQPGKQAARLNTEGQREGNTCSEMERRDSLRSCGEVTAERVRRGINWWRRGILVEKQVTVIWGGGGCPLMILTKWVFSNMETGVEGTEH